MATEWSFTLVGRFEPETGVAAVNGDEIVGEKLDAIARFALARDAVREWLADAEAKVDAACIVAREAGASWDEVAAVAGMSRQAVQKRISECQRASDNDSN